MLNLTLNTNEVKNAAGVEVEFNRLGTNGRSAEYAQVSEPPNLEYRLTINHQEIGSGAARRRRSKIGFDKQVVGASLQTRDVICYCVLDAPVGDLSTDTEIKNVIANLMSFLATTGAATTVLFDCTGSGASVLVSGGIQ